MGSPRPKNRVVPGPPLRGHVIDDVAQREYEPQRIVAERGQTPSRRLLVRWRGYPPSAATWESEASMVGKDVLTEWDS